MPTTAKTRKRRISKADLKRVRESATKGHLDRLRRRLAPIERNELKGSDLPFIARRFTSINPTYDDDLGQLKDFEWSIGACDIADAALRRGYRLLVRCRPDFVAPATCQIVRQLRTPVRVWWNCNHNVLILKLFEEDVVDDDEDASEES